MNRRSTEKTGMPGSETAIPCAPRKSGMIMNVTTRCNQTCDFCYLRLDERDIPLDRALSIVEENSASLTNLTLTGGEPFLYPHLLYFMKEIAPLGLRLNVNTNATVKPAAMLAALDSSPVTFWIGFSERTTLNRDDVRALRDGGSRAYLSVPLFESTLERVAHLCALTDICDGVLLLVPTPSPLNAIAPPAPEDWLKRLDRAIQELRSHTDCIFYEPAYKPASRQMAPRCLSGRDIIVHVNGLSYPCCLLVDRFQGEMATSPVRIEDHQCPVLAAFDAIASDGYQALCPLFVEKVGSEASGGHLAYLSEASRGRDS